MNDHHTTFGDKIVTFLTWLAAALGLGTFAGLVNVSVGLLSAGWIVIQIMNYFSYTRPINQARLEKARAGLLEACDTDRGDSP